MKYNFDDNEWETITPDIKKAEENIIAKYRKRKNLRQEDLAKLVGVSESTVYRWENRIEVPKPDKMIALSKIFGFKAIHNFFIIVVKDYEKWHDIAISTKKGYIQNKK